MNTPRSPFALSLATRAQQITVLSAEGDGPPPDTAETNEMFVASIKRAAGGRDLDHARIEQSLPRASKRIQDIQSPVAYRTWLTAQLSPPRSKLSPIVLFTGAVGRQTIQLTDSTESSTHTARVEPFHFGSPVVGPRVVDPDGETRDLHTDVVFNPMVDGIVRGNRSSWSDPERGNFWWIDPESARTDGSKAANGDQTANLWTLAQAVVSLCRLANPDEDLILNPTVAEVSRFLVGGPALRNWKLPRGKYLPELLDAMLHPHGFDWWLRPVRVGDPVETKLQIQLFRRGAGIEVDLYRGRVGSNVTTSDNLRGLTIEWNIADIANRIRVQSARKLREVTIELKRGWPEADDELMCDDIRKSDADSQFAAKPNAWRRWVANEAGDYADTRPTEVSGKPWLTIAADEFLDVREFLDVADVPRRRKFERPITFDADPNAAGERRQCLVEMWNPDDDTWKELTGWNLLEHEMGIYFDGDIPPDDLRLLDQDARVRITACVESDIRDEAIATRRNESPNGADIELVLDLSDRFFDRKRAVQAPYASVLTGAADTRDDHDALVEYAEKVRDIEDAAKISASITLRGIETAYEIGQLVRKVDGRNISLNQFSDDAEAKRYLQIVAIEWDMMAQATTLTVETFDDVKIQKQVL